mmetsp:Transcript_5025/g.11995  ORF Transcript_5025/g.11995 Transcript_5025/m.11995 type:complete len:225 (+) Transcript_5025:87-761(+)
MEKLQYLSPMTDSTQNVLFVLASASIVALAFRAVKRSRSPIIETKLCCPCGKVKGTIRAKYEDSERIYCCSTDCRAYNKAIAGLGGKCNKSLNHEYGETHVCQFCKSAATIDGGLEHIKLARKAPNEGAFRYYADCCNAPLMNTADFVAFVGFYEDILDENHKKFHGPVVLFENEAEKPFDLPIPKISVPRLLWGLVRYLPYRDAGPFDYGLEPFYWGDNKKTD